MIRFVTETGSTNTDLASELHAGMAVPEGEWLVADRQVSGRGRQGRAWFDGYGNFMGSTVVHLSPRDPNPATLALVAGVAAYEAVSGVLADPSLLKLKWPNDLLLRNAKLAGILLEREGNAVIVGMGVNLVAAPDLPDRRTIALTNFGPPPDREIFARSLSYAFDQELDRWRTYGLEPLIRRWESVAHPRGASLTVNVPGEQRIEGAFDGLTAEGTLLLRLEDGSTRAIHAGDVMLANEGN